MNVHDQDLYETPAPSVPTDWEAIAHTVFLTFAIATCVAGIALFGASIFARNTVLFQLAGLPVVAGLLGLACLFGIASFLLGRAE
jgi:hypothetical protein